MFKKYLARTLFVLLLVTLLGLGAAVATDHCLPLCYHECSVTYQTDLARCALMPTPAEREICAEKVYWEFETCWNWCNALCKD
jgi:hypothetical protein